MLQFPYNLYKELSVEPPQELPKDLLGTFFYVVTVCAPTGSELKSLKVMTARYIRGMKLGDIADEVELTTERVRQIAKRATTPMREERYTQMLLVGMEEYFRQKEEAAKEETEREILAAVCPTAKVNMDSSVSFHELMTMLPMDDPRPCRATAHVSKLQISTRTLNSLGRHKIETVAQLLGHSRKSLLKLKGIGEKQINDIIDALERNGYNASNFKKRKKQS